MALEVDATVEGRVSSPTYQGTTGGGFVVIACAVLAGLAILMVGWFALGAHSINNKVADLTSSSSELDQEITQANTAGGQIVENRAQELLVSFKQYQKLVDGRTAWSKVLPALASQTLQGVTLSGMSIDDKMNIKVDGVSAGWTSGSDSFTPYGMVARQVVAYRDALYKDAPADSKTKSGAPAVSSKLFATVVLNSVAEQTKTDKAGHATTSASFSVTLTLNPAAVVLPPIVAANTAKAVPQ